MFYYFNAEMKYYEKPPTLNEATWDYIRQAAQNGTASDLWSVGDRKEIILNGTCESRTFDNYKVYAYILGFNHNAELEGDKTITFQIGFNDLTDGKHIALMSYKMMSSNVNQGGWERSKIRTTTIPAFISCLPSDLQNALKAVNKYTNNAGQSSYENAVTATQDKVFLLSEYEVTSQSTYSNPYEQNKQAQYDYYKNLGNSRVRYNDMSPVSSANWWLRSPYHIYMDSYDYINTGGGQYYTTAATAYGFAPAFVVG